MTDYTSNVASKLRLREQSMGRRSLKFISWHSIDSNNYFSLLFLTFLSTKYIKRKHYYRQKFDLEIFIRFHVLGFSEAWKNSFGSLSVYSQAESSTQKQKVLDKRNLMCSFYTEIVEHYEILDETYQREVLSVYPFMWIWTQ